MSIYCCNVSFFFFNDTATTEIYTLSLHDALPILKSRGAAAARIGQYKKRGRCRNENRGSIKSEVLPQREMGSIKSGALLQREMGSLKSGALPQREMGCIKSGGAAAARIEIGRAHV